MKHKPLWPLLLTLLLILSSCAAPAAYGQTQGAPGSEISPLASAVWEAPSETEGETDTIPAFDGVNPYVVLNGNVPAFTEAEITDVSFETYSELDALGRCGVCIASLGRDLMPQEEEERESISSVTPSGWHQNEYASVESGYVLNRCHLIGWQLAGENANENNLIAGTRFLNVDGMLPFENMVADYILETGNHVMYRVTPIFTGDNLFADGVEMEGYSVEDQGEGIFFHVFCYNAQPGVEFDYLTGENWAAEGDSGEQTAPSSTLTPAYETEEGAEDDPSEITYVLNKNSMKFHLPDCAGAAQIAQKNREETDKDRQTLLDEGYDPCGNCNP